MSRDDLLAGQASQPSPLLVKTKSLSCPAPARASPDPQRTTRRSVPTDAFAFVTETIAAAFSGPSRIILLGLMMNRIGE